MKKQGRFYEGMQRPMAPYCHAVRVGDWLYISGITARGTDVQAGSVKEQTEAVLKRLQSILEAEGGSLRDLVRITTYVAERNGFKDVAEVRRAFFPFQDQDDLPSSTMVGVAQLNSASAEEDLKVEVDAIALVPEK